MRRYLLLDEGRNARHYNLTLTLWRTICMAVNSVTCSNRSYFVCIVRWHIISLDCLFSRREGVLHQVQKLTDPDNPICLNQFSESPLSSWSTPQALPSNHLASGRSWTVAGTSLANMFPEQLRVAKRRDNNDGGEDGHSGSGRGSATPTSSHHHSSPTGKPCW